MITKRFAETRAARFTATQTIRRTTNLPDDIAFTICGWGRIVVDTNNFMAIACIEDVTSGSPAGYVQLGSAVDGTTLTLYANGSTDTTLRNIVVGRDFFWALTSSGLNAANTAGYTRYVHENGLTSAAMSGGARGAFTPAHVAIGNDAASEPFNGRLWNVMCFNRALSAWELLRQSYYQYPVDPTALNFWWPDLQPTAVLDWSENRRDGAITGTITAEQVEILLINRVYPRKVLFLPAAGGSISGSASLNFSLAGAIAGTGALAGSSALSFTPAAALTAAGALAGTSALSFSNAGALAGTGVLAGASALAFSTAGAIAGAGAMTTLSALSFALTGTLNAPSGALNGSAAIAFSVTGVLRGAGALAGTSAMQFSPIGVARGAGALAGAAAMTFGSSAFLNVKVPIAGTASMHISASGLLLAANGVIGDVGPRLVVARTSNRIIGVSDADHFVHARRRLQ